MSTMKPKKKLKILYAMIALMMAASMEKERKVPFLTRWALFSYAISASWVLLAT